MSRTGLERRSELAKAPKADSRADYGAASKEEGDELKAARTGDSAGEASRTSGSSAGGEPPLVGIRHARVAAEGGEPPLVGIRHARVVAEGGVLEDAGVLWRGDTIVALGAGRELDAYPGAAEATWLDAAGGWVLPGFIDVHVHGGYGHDFMDGTPGAFAAIAAFHARHGTTGLLATSVTAPPEAIRRLLAAAAAFRLAPGAPAAELYGVHLEGPFISPKWPGAQNPAFIAPPSIPWLEAWHAEFPGLIRMMTLAPEQDGALDAIRWLAARGIIAACGHTDAAFEDIERAVDAGLSHAVHTFNAMRGLHHREPGTVGAVLSEPRIAAEVIADGLHVHPACIRLLTAAKNNRNLLLITDAISAAGLGDGDYALGGLEVTVAKGAARLKSTGALAGSTLTMLQAFRYMVGTIGLSVAEASELASGNPARRLGLYALTGSLAAGKRADLLLLDAALGMRQVWSLGRAVAMANPDRGA